MVREAPTVEDYTFIKMAVRKASRPARTYRGSPKTRCRGGQRPHLPRPNLCRPSCPLLQRPELGGLTDEEVDFLVGLLERSSFAAGETVAMVSEGAGDLS